MARPMVELRGVTKRFGAFEAVRDLSLEICEGEFLTLLGASGSGKTTTLRMVAGFEKPTSGEIFMAGERITDLPPYRRNVNTVFQSYALFPHMTVLANVGFGLRMKGLAGEEINRRSLEALDKVKLTAFRDRYPKQLSGGQQQRAALARALVNRPRVLLLDEPLGALDLKLRKEMQLELKHLQQEVGITFVYVTHDQEEALVMSDRIALLHHGSMVQLDTPEGIYHRPATKFAADFIGETNLLAVEVVEVAGDRASVKLGDRPLAARVSASMRSGQRAFLCVRPEACSLQHSKPPDANMNALEAEIAEQIFVGPAVRTRLSLKSGQTITAAARPDRSGHTAGRCWVVWAPEDAVLIPATDED